MSIKTVSFQHAKCLGIAEISMEGHDSLKYTSCARAIKKGILELHEVSEAGSVNSIIVQNSGKEYVFMMDGDILSGAKQTRVLNTSVYLAPRSKTVIPVSCVERGRWRYVSRVFGMPEYSSPVMLRAQKSSAVRQSLLKKAGYVARQGEVWTSVDKYHDTYGTRSSTASLSDLYDERKQDFDSFVAQFKAGKEANGLAVFLHQQLLTMEIFNRRNIYREYFPKILRGVAIEAFHLKEKKTSLDQGAAAAKVDEIWKRYQAFEKTSHPGVALGSEKRFESGNLTGFTLEYNEKVVHLTMMNLMKDDVD